MSLEKDKSKLIGFCVLISISTALITNVFLFRNAQSLLSIENFNYDLSMKALPVLIAMVLIHYSAMAIGLVASFHSHSENNFRDLSKPYLAYLAYLVFVFDVGSYAWRNWT